MKIRETHYINYIVTKGSSLVTVTGYLACRALPMLKSMAPGVSQGVYNSNYWKALEWMSF